MINAHLRRRGVNAVQAARWDAVSNAQALITHATVAARSSPTLHNAVRVGGVRRFATPLKQSVVTISNERSSKPNTTAANAAATSTYKPTSVSSSAAPPLPSASPFASADVALTLETGLGSSLRHLLSGPQRVLLLDIKAHLKSVREQLKQLVYLSSEDSRWLKIALQSSEELFLVVVVGEFNSGKSSILNSLLGGEHCMTGVLPTTEQIHILRYTNGPKEVIRESENVVSVLLPLPFLKDTSFCDTPGTNAVLRSHELITNNFIPRADLILFLTSVDRPFSESERNFLKNIEQWQKKVAFVLNKMDLVRKESDRDKIISFVKRNAAETLLASTHGSLSNANKSSMDLHIPPTPSVANSTASASITAAQNASPNKNLLLDRTDDVVLFPISAENALQGKLKLQEDPNSAEGRQLLSSSGIGALETYIFETLTTETKLHMKLSNPLGIASRILEKYQIRVKEREKEWKDIDGALLDSLKNQRKEFENSSSKDLQMQQLKLAHIFDKMKASSDEFLQAKLKLSNIRELFSSEQLKSNYEQAVYRNLKSETELIFSKMFDYLSESSSTSIQRMHGAIRNRIDQINTRHEGMMQQQSRAMKAAFDPNSAGVAKSVANLGASPTTTPSLFPATVTAAITEVQGAFGQEAAGSSFSAFVTLQKETSPLLLPNVHGASSAVAEQSRSALINTLMLQVSSLGLGSVFVLSSMSAIALTAVPAYAALGGWVTLGAAGLYALPLVRARLSKTLRENLDKQHRDLSEIFERCVAAQREQTLRYMDNSILKNYSAYVNVEGDELKESKKLISALLAQRDELRVRIQQLTAAEEKSIQSEQKVVVSPLDVTPIDVIEKRAPASTATKNV